MGKASSLSGFQSSTETPSLPNFPEDRNTWYAVENGMLEASSTEDLVHIRFPI